MKRNYAKAIFLSVALLTAGVNAAYAIVPDDNKKESKDDNQKEDAEETVAAFGGNWPEAQIHGTGQTVKLAVNSSAIPGKEIHLTAPNGFSVSPTVIPANSGEQTVTVTLNSSKKLTRGYLILRSGDERSYVQLNGYGTALPVKDISKSPIYKGGKDASFSKKFKPGKNGYTIEFRLKTEEVDQAFEPYFVNEHGQGFKAFIGASEVALYNSGKKGIANPATANRAGGKGQFYNMDGQAHTYRIAVTPDSRAYIYRDGVAVDSVRLADYAPQVGWATGKGKMTENLLKNGGFEGEYDLREKDLVSGVEGWNVVIQDRWNSEQNIEPQELDNNQDVDNHVFRIRPYKWSGGWGDGTLMQVVDVVPGETYTLSALLKGGIAKKAGTLTGKFTIAEEQDREKKSVTEIASDEWEMYSMDYTASAQCNQLRISISVGKGKWGHDISAVYADNVKLTGVGRTYTPKYGFENNTAQLEYFTIDNSGAYAPAQPTITVQVK